MTNLSLHDRFQVSLLNTQQQNFPILLAFLRAKKSTKKEQQQISNPTVAGSVQLLPNDTLQECLLKALDVSFNSYGRFSTTQMVEWWSFLPFGAGDWAWSPSGQIDISYHRLANDATLHCVSRRMSRIRAPLTHLKGTQTSIGFNFFRPVLKSSWKVRANQSALIIFYNKTSPAQYILNLLLKYLVGRSCAK